ncbi:MAG: carbonic anhydrase [Phycisphaeraceae bacterium]
MSDTTFTSSVPFDPDRFDGIAVYCSDGRFGQQCDEFLRRQLGLSRVDRLVVPGGAGALVDHDKARLEATGLLDELAFLAEAHRLNHVVLINHQQCGFYLGRPGVEPGELEALQKRDLAAAAERVRALPQIERVDAYLACSEDGAVRFAAVETA